MSNTKFKGLLAGAAVGAIFALSGGQASAATLNIDRVTNNAATDVSNQLSVEVLDNADSSAALFTFRASTGDLSGFRITELYWSDLSGIFSPPPSVVDSSNGINDSVVSFDLGASPGVFPGGNDADPPFSITSGLLMEADNPAPTNGVGIGEFITVGLNYDSGFSFQDVIDDLFDGDLRIAMRVTGIPDRDESDGFVGGGCTGGTDCFPTGDPPSAIPLPAGLPLILTALGVFGALRLRKRKTA